jgi:hypothetical protein
VVLCKRLGATQSRRRLSLVSGDQTLVKELHLKISVGNYGICYLEAVHRAVRENSKEVAKSWSLRGVRQGGDRHAGKDSEGRLRQG